MSVESFGKFKPSNKQLEVVGYVRNFVIEFFIDVNHARLARLAAITIVETEHIVARRKTVSKIDTDCRVSQLAAAKCAAEST